MSEEITSEMISRRATFSLLGAAAALSVAAPATPLTAAEAAFGIRGDSQACTIMSVQRARPEIISTF